MPNKKLLKKIWLSIVIGICSFAVIPNHIYADDTESITDFNIMPKLEDKEIEDVNKEVESIGQNGWHVWEKYNDVAPTFTTSQQVASWIMNRDTIMNYLVFIVQFLSQLGMAVWLIFIMYAGYKYMTNVFKGKTWKQPLINTILWIVIIIFSYAIMKILTSFVWLS